MPYSANVTIAPPFESIETPPVKNAQPAQSAGDTKGIAAQEARKRVIRDLARILNDTAKDQQVGFVEGIITSLHYYGIDVKKLGPCTEGHLGNFRVKFDDKFAPLNLSDSSHGIFQRPQRLLEYADIPAKKKRTGRPRKEMTPAPVKETTPTQPQKQKHTPEDVVNQLKNLDPDVLESYLDSYERFIVPIGAKQKGAGGKKLQLNTVALSKHEKSDISRMAIAENDAELAEALAQSAQSMRQSKFTDGT
jgi:hypothetical protein